MGNENRERRPIDLLEAANKKKIKNIRVELPPFEAIMSTPDMFTIMEEQEAVKALKYAELKKRGFHRHLIDDDEWEKELEESLRLQREAAKKAGRKFDERETRKRLEADRPCNLAQQLALKASKLRTVEEIIPKILKKEDGKTLLLETDEDRVRFKEIVRADFRMFTYLLEKYSELVVEWTKNEDEAKNSSEAENLENGDSRNSAPGDTPATGDPSTPD